MTGDTILAGRGWLKNRQPEGPAATKPAVAGCNRPAQWMPPLARVCSLRRQASRPTGGSSLAARPRARHPSDVHCKTTSPTRVSRRGKTELPTTVSAMESVSGPLGVRFGQFAGAQYVAVSASHRSFSHVISGSNAASALASALTSARDQYPASRMGRSILCVARAVSRNAC